MGWLNPTPSFWCHDITWEKEINWCRALSLRTAKHWYYICMYWGRRRLICVLQFHLNKFFLYHYLLSRCQPVLYTQQYIFHLLCLSKWFIVWMMLNFIKELFVCKDQHVEKNHELFVRNNIFLRDIHSKLIFFIAG